MKNLVLLIIFGLVAGCDADPSGPDSNVQCIERWTPVRGSCAASKLVCGPAAASYANRIIRETQHNWGAEYEVSSAEDCPAEYIGGRDFRQEVDVAGCALTCDIRFDGFIGQ